MSNELVLPTTEEMCEFVEAYFAGQDWELDTKSKSGHLVYRVPGHPVNIPIPKNRAPIVRPTFNSILDLLGVSVAEFRRIAGTPQLRKAYAKARRGEVRTTYANDAVEPASPS